MNKKDYQQQYYIDHREGIRERRRLWWIAQIETYRGEKRQKRQVENMSKINKVTLNRWRWKRRLHLISLLGSKCRKCGIDDPRVLQINHINGNGIKDYKKRGSNGLYNDILSGKRRKDDLELLCANCNVLYEYEQGRRYAGLGLDKD